MLSFRYSDFKATEQNIPKHIAVTGGLPVKESFAATS
jgi:hypothetical protein